MSGSRIERIRAAGPDHQVVSIGGEGTGGHCTRPCAKCPWRMDAVGEFPAEAFRHSAETAYDMSRHVFACHASDKTDPGLCAGFLLHGAAHNLAVRLMRIRGEVGDVSDGGHRLFRSYREMAIANGVEPSDPALSDCRK